MWYSLFHAKKQIEQNPPSIISSRLNSEIAERSNSINAVKIDLINKHNSNASKILETKRKLDDESSRLDQTRSDLINKHNLNASKIISSESKLSKEVEGVKAKITNQSSAHSVGLVTLESKLKQELENKTKESIKKVSDLGQKVAVKTSVINDRVRKLNNDLRTVGIKTEQALNNSVVLSSKNRDLEGYVQSLFAPIMKRNLIMQKGLSGNLHLSLDLPDAEDVSAAALNAAVAGSFIKNLTINLTSHDGIGNDEYVHDWCNSGLTITPAEAVADADVLAPEVENITGSSDPLDLNAGALSIKVIFDTDAGSTKTYVNGESVTITIKVAADDKLLGYSVTEIIKTYNVIA